MRGFLVEEERNEGKNDIRHPGCQCRWPVGIDGKGGRDGLEQDVGRTERQTYAQIKPHAAFPFACRKRKANDGQDERSEGGGKPLLVFHLERFDVAGSAGTLLDDILL